LSGNGFYQQMDVVKIEVRRCSAGDELTDVLEHVGTVKGCVAMR
jgi:hypothetical protein